ncbi:kynureninase [Metasolibacillus meyeri]|uniref:Kynureninase n=1 Tax=Metasolibacillus meyeri TaxID=1071052 RepID=A0AAW9NVP4_9BACL|nr:kynureninase [Metasolibacillus meyeri]MEC1178998.1 kynureninase [Metasolibacillus meyeri]
MTTNSLTYAKSLDETYEIPSKREAFYIQEGRIYFDGNSLGLMSKRAEETLHSLLGSWKEYGIDGWTQGEHAWFFLAEKLGAQMAPIVGANKEEVIVTGSTTSNLHQLVATFYKPEGKRTKILADELNFPSDIYALKSQLALKGYDESHLIRVASRDGQILDEDDIIAAMTDEVALIVLPGVLYRSGQILNMEKLTQAAHDRDIMIGFDLCHSVGSVVHQLHDWDVDFAFWCTYKHLNGGPGSTGALFVHEKHFGTAPGLAGWFGSNKEKQFTMSHTFEPASEAGAFQIGTPNVLSMAPLLGALELFNEMGIANVRKRSLALSDYMLKCVEDMLGEYDFKVCSPTAHHERGGHIYLEHPDAARICKALKERNVVPDFRAPQGIRLAAVAMYNTFEEVYKCFEILKDIMETKAYEKFSNEREIVA